MSSKRKGDAMEGPTGRDKKKQKTAQARTIAVQSGQPSIASTSSQNAVAGPSRAVQFEGLPSSIDVERFTEARAFEINAMHSAMKTARADVTKRAWQLLPRHLRRRAASHDVRRVPLRLRDKARAEMDPARRKALGRSMPKRSKKEQLPRTQVFLKRQANKVWLETHIWHAKRMHMENMWGYRLAVQPTEKSFRPSHRASMHGSILHDASYYGFMELKGPEHVLRAILESCCDLQGPSPGAKRFSSGSRTCETHFYQRDKYPFGLIAPGTVIWQPVLSVENPKGKKPNTTSKNANGGKGKGKVPQPVDDATRSVWVKIHPSVFEEVYAELRTTASFALEAAKKASPPPDDKPYEVELADLREHLAVFEIMGPKSSQVIRGALRPVAEDDRPEFKKTWAALGDLQTTASVPRNAIVGFKVYDPRLSFPPKNAKVHTDGQNGSQASQPAVAFYPISTLAQSEIWGEDTRLSLRKPHYKKRDIDERKSKNLVPGTSLQATAKDDRIPVLLIQRSIESTSDSPSVHGWTLIVPSGWAMPFFSSLIFTGTRVGGQRERQTQAFEAGTVYFPRDYPSTASYDVFAENAAEEDKAQWERKPPAKRPNYAKLGSRSPWKPDWEVVLGLRSADTSDDLMPAQRGENGEENEMDVDHTPADATPVETRAAPLAGEDALEPWLLRGPAVTDALTAARSMFNPSNGLLEYMNKLRQKRGFTPLTTRGADLWRSALVRVRVRMCGRGRPEDLSLLYVMDDEEMRKWMRAEGIRRRGPGGQMEEDAEDETELSIVVPSQDSIIGYVTSGNFSLSLGEGCAIAAIPLAKLFEINEQARRLGTEKALVKVRERHEIICRAAYIEVIAD